MPLSIVRAEIFGDIQAHITQALRRGTAPETAISANRATDVGYEAGARNFEKIADTLERALLASFYHLAMAGADAAISILLELRPQIDLSSLASLISEPEYSADNVVTLHPVENGSPSLTAVLNDQTACPALADFVADSKKIARRISRKGFAKPETGSSEIEIQGFATAADALLDIRKSVSRFTGQVRRIAEAKGDWNALDMTDREIFFNQFRQLYGVCT